MESTLMGFLDGEVESCQNKKVIVKAGPSSFSANKITGSYTPNESSLESLPEASTLISLQENSFENEQSDFPKSYHTTGNNNNNNNNNGNQFMVKKQNSQEQKIDLSGNSSCINFRVYCGSNATVNKNGSTLRMRDSYEVIFKDGIVTFRTFIDGSPKPLDIIMRSKTIKEAIVQLTYAKDNSITATVRLVGQLEMILNSIPADASTKEGTMEFKSVCPKFNRNYMSQLKGFGIQKVIRSQGSAQGLNGTMYDTLDKLKQNGSGSGSGGVADLSAARMSLERITNIKPPILPKESVLDTTARSKIKSITSTPSNPISTFNDYNSYRPSRRDGIPLPDEILSISPIVTRTPKKPKLPVDGDEVMIIYPEKEDTGKTSQVKIIRNDIKRLDPGEFLNDSIIEFYTLYIKEKFLTEVQRSKCFFFNSFFYKKFTNKSNPDDAYQEIKKWTGQEDIFDKDFIFVPINQSAHWSMMILCYPGVVRDPDDPTTNRSCMIYLDSLFKTASSIATRLRKYLTLEWKHKKVKEGVVEPRTFELANYPLRRPHVPQQNNGTDCGVYLLQYLELFCKDPEIDFKFPLERPGWFNQADIKRKRIEIRKLIYQIRESQFPDQRTLQEEEKFELVYTSGLNKGYQLGSSSLSPNSSSLEIIEEIPTPYKFKSIIETNSTATTAATSKIAPTKMETSYDDFIKSNGYPNYGQESIREDEVEKRTSDLLDSKLPTFTGAKKRVHVYNDEDDGGDNDDEDNKKEKQGGSSGDDEDKSSNKLKKDLDVEGKTTNTNDQKNLLDDFKSSVNINKEEEEEEKEKEEKESTIEKKPNKRILPKTITEGKKKFKSDDDFTTSGSDIDDGTKSKKDKTIKRQIRLPNNNNTSKRSRDSDEDKQKKKKSQKCNNHEDELSVPPVSTSEKKSFSDMLFSKTAKSIGGLRSEDLDKSIDVDDD